MAPDYADEPVFNPWAGIAPQCIHCGGNRVYLWMPTGTLRWCCGPCGRRFDPEPVTPKRKKPASDPKVHEALVARDSEKFPALRKLTTKQPNSTAD